MRYTILQKLGQGGMGIVYRARQIGLDREVALKILPPGQLDDEGAKRLHREVKVLASLSHPNLVRVFDSGNLDGRLFYTMELVCGQDLAAMIHESGALPVERALRLMAQAADALAYLHGLDLTHRDVKPANLMVDDRDHLVLMDLGMVKVPTATLITRENELPGTPRYLAPELLSEDDATARPSQDMWALGLTMHELLTGRVWAEGSMHEVLRTIVGGTLPSLATALPGSPRWLVDLQAATLSRDPANRPAAAEYRDAILGRTSPEPEAPGGRARAPAGEGTPDGPRPRAPSGRRGPGSDSRLRAGRLPGLSSGSHPLPAAGGARPAVRALAAVAVVAAVVLALSHGRQGPPVERAGRSSGAPARPAADPVDAAGIGLDTPGFPEHRVVAVRLRRPVAPGTRVELRVDGRSVARAPATTAGKARLEDVPPGRAGELVAVIGEKVLCKVTVTTPVLGQIRRFQCHPTDRSVLVDFDLADPVRRSGDLRVEILRSGRSRPVASAPVEPGNRFRREFLGLDPSTGYAIRVSQPGGWLPLADYRIVTLSRRHSATLKEVLARVDGLPQQAGLAAEYFQTAPDLRVVEPLCRILQTRPIQSIPWAYRMAWLAQNLRSRELTDCLLARVRPEDDPSTFSDVVSAVAACRHPLAAQIAKRVLEHPATDGLAVSAARALLAAGGAAACERVADLVERNPSHARLLGDMVECDAGTARRRFETWLEARSAQDDLLASMAARGLSLIRDRASAAFLGRILARGCAPVVRRQIVDRLAAMGEPEGARALVGELAKLVAGGVAAPARARGPAGEIEAAWTLELVWAVARSAGTGAPPDSRDGPCERARPLLVAILKGARTPALRQAAACALALCQRRDCVSELVTAMSDPDAGVQSAAAWALGRLAKPAAEGPLTARLSSGLDRDGTAAWALGRLGTPTAVAALRSALEKLRPGAGGDPAAAVRLGVTAVALHRAGDPASRPLLDRLLADGSTPPLVREWIQADVEIPDSSPDGRRRAGVSRRSVHDLFPFVRYDRLGLAMAPGESLAVQVKGRWYTGGRLVHPDESTKLEGPARPGIAGEEPQPARLGTVLDVGGRNARIGRSVERLLVDQECELTASPLIHPGSCPGTGSTTAVIGLARIVIDR